MDRMHEMPALPVPSEMGVRQFATDWIANKLAYLPGTTVLLPSRDSAPWLHDWWVAAERPPGRMVTPEDVRTAGGDITGPDVTFAVLAAGDWKREPAIRCIEALLLPGADRSAVVAEAVLELCTGTGRPVVLLVPGTSSGPSFRLTPAALDRLRRAEAIARGGGVRAVLVSGWAGPEAREPEAHQLRKAWAGPPLPVITDPAARTTAENGLCCARLITGLTDVREVVLVTSWSNALRQHVLARAAFRGRPVAVRSQVLWGRVHARSLWPGIAGLLRLRRHLRAGAALLRYGPADPRARP